MLSIIDRNGVLFLQPETETEIIALKDWFAKEADRAVRICTVLSYEKGALLERNQFGPGVFVVENRDLVRSDRDKGQVGSQRERG